MFNKSEQTSTSDLFLFDLPNPNNCLKKPVLFSFFGIFEIDCDWKEGVGSIFFVLLFYQL